jgi:hypothetical protein
LPYISPYIPNTNALPVLTVPGLHVPLFITDEPAAKVDTPVTVRLVLIVAAPVIASVEPSKVKFASELTLELSTDVTTLLFVEFV